MSATAMRLMNAIYVNNPTYEPFTDGEIEEFGERPLKEFDRLGRLAVKRHSDALRRLADS